MAGETEPMPTGGGRAAAVMPRGRWVAVLLLAGAGLGLSGYLTYQGMTGSGLPPGCGGDAGCGAVLTSRWASVLGAPVSVLAALAYLAALPMLGVVGWSGVSAGVRRAAWAGLGVIAGAVLGAAAWFVYLQAVVVGAWCAYCLADHGVGVAWAGVVLSGSRLPGRGKVLPPVAGLGGAALLAVVQVAAPAPEVPGSSLPTDRDFDRMIDGSRRVAVLGGALQLDLSEEATLGPTDAEHVVVMMLDYACPHCRATHQFLRKQQKAGASLCIVDIPAPLDRACNPHSPYTAGEVPDRFAESCELARLALAVHAVEPGKYAGFADWLYQTPEARSAAEARARAERAVGAAALDAALSGQAIDAQLQRNAEAYGASGKRRIPVVVAPFADPYPGRLTSAAVLEKLLSAGEDGASEAAENGKGGEGGGDGR